MDQKKIAVTAKRMTEARAVLIRDNPFFVLLTLGLQLFCAPCGTACTDGEKLFFDPAFAEQLGTEREMQFVVLHEILHCILDHCTRGRTLYSQIYNIACDIVVNSIILGMWGLDTFSVAGEEVIHLAPDRREGREYNAEEIYRMLIKKTDHAVQYSRLIPRQSSARDAKNKAGDPVPRGEGTTLDRHDLWKTIQNPSMIRDRWNRRILEASRSSDDRNRTSPAIRTLTENLLRRSKTDWRQLLHDFIQHDIYDYSFLPPDRRFTDADFYLPAYNVDEDQGSANDIWVCVDTSGSISDRQLTESMQEIQNAILQAGLTGSISFFDADITEPVPFSTEEEIRKLTPVGGGGTSFRPIFEYLQEKFQPDLPKAILVFTDGHVNSWPEEKEALGVPVLWLICKGGSTSAPWGRTAEID